MSNPTPAPCISKHGGPQLLDSKAQKRNSGKNPRALTPQIRALIAADCKAHGSVYAAKVWKVPVGTALEIQIDRLTRLIETQREQIARLERQAA